MDLDTIIDYLQSCRDEFGGDTQVVLSADFSDEDLNDDFIALDQIPGISEDDL